MSKSKVLKSKLSQHTFPTNNIGTKKEGTADTNPTSKYSNSVKCWKIYYQSFILFYLASDTHKNMCVKVRCEIWHHILVKQKEFWKKKTSYRLKGTTIPRIRVSQKGEYNRKNSSPHRLLGFVASHKLGET